MNGLSRAEGVEAWSLAASRHQHRSIGKNGRVVLAPPEIHWRSALPRWLRTIQVDDLDLVRRQLASVVIATSDINNFTFRIHRGRSIIPGSQRPLAYTRPVAIAGRVKQEAFRIGAAHKHTAVRGEVKTREK